MFGKHFPSKLQRQFLQSKATPWLLSLRVSVLSRLNCRIRVTSFRGSFVVLSPFFFFLPDSPPVSCWVCASFFVLSRHTFRACCITLALCWRAFVEPATCDDASWSFWKASRERKKAFALSFFLIFSPCVSVVLHPKRNFVFLNKEKTQSFMFWRVPHPGGCF